MDNAASRYISTFLLPVLSCELNHASLVRHIELIKKMANTFFYSTELLRNKR